MTKDEALRMARRALYFAHDDGYSNELSQEAITAIKEALAQPEKEPVGTVKELFTQAAWERLDLRGSTKVYITPPQRKPLTLEDLERLHFKHAKYQEESMGISGWVEYARAIEAAHGIKENT